MSAFKGALRFITSPSCFKDSDASFKKLKAAGTLIGAEPGESGEPGEPGAAEEPGAAGEPFELDIPDHELAANALDVVINGTISANT